MESEIYELFLAGLAEDIYDELKIAYHKQGIDFNLELTDIRKMTLAEVASLFAVANTMPKVVAMDRFFDLMQGSYEAGQNKKLWPKSEDNLTP